MVLVPGHREAERLTDQLQTLARLAGLNIDIATAHYGIQVGGVTVTTSGKEEDLGEKRNMVKLGKGFKCAALLMGRRN